MFLRLSLENEWFSRARAKSPPPHMNLSGVAIPIKQHYLEINFIP